MVVTLADVLSAFEGKFQQKGRVFASPGRINFIGEHLDYNQGVSLPMAIDKYTWIEILKSEETYSELYALNFNESFIPNVDKEEGDKGWKAMVVALLDILNKKEVDVPSFSCVFGGNIPIGAGLSSSASFICGLIFGLNSVFRLGFDRMEMALIAQETEHKLGVNCGLMDQLAILFSEKSKILQIDFQDLGLTYHRLDNSLYELVLVNSEVSHKLVESDYGNRQSEAREALEILEKSEGRELNWREINNQIILRAKSLLPELLQKRARFIVGEILRVSQFILEMESGNIHKMGLLLSATQNGLTFDYEVSCPEVDFIVNFFEMKKGIMGARMIGGGFGGCVLLMVRKGEMNNSLMENFKSSYKNEWDLDAQIFHVGPSDRVSEL